MGIREPFIRRPGAYPIVGYETWIPVGVKSKRGASSVLYPEAKRTAPALPPHVKEPKNLHIDVTLTLEELVYK